ncbi:MAG: hypothetical protein D3926_03885 [Desulfobacteraceae bacterium]|nr:MAG: hypothetical protein D3926_03885 [Desulfobacteraceae bacterium]
MKKRFQIIVVQAFTILAILAIAAAPMVCAADKGISLSRSGHAGVLVSPLPDTYPIMQPDHDTLMEWIRDYEAAVPMSTETLNVPLPPQGARSLLSYLTYTPSQRNQGSCGDCWAWAGTGVMEIDLNMNEQVADRLSVQFINSCFTGSYACCGGNLTDVSDFYTTNPVALPWANSNAPFADANRTCSSGFSIVTCNAINTSPNYPIDAMSVSSISTRYLSQAAAIANIKAVLDAGKAVWFAFYLPDDTSWNAFYNFWNNQAETALWDPDPYCGQSWVTDEGGGHAVLCVGYNDNDPNPANHYWEIVNSWGTANGGRPNGIYRMKMDIDYSCILGYGSGTLTALQWQTLNVDWGTVTADPGECTLVSDGSFENGPPPSSAWTAWGNTVCGGPITDPTVSWSIPAYHGTYASWFGGYCNNTDPVSSYVQQSIQVPADASILTFYANYYRVDSDDPAAPDYLWVKADGTTIFTRELKTANNTYPNWIREVVDISAYRGQTVTLRFEVGSAGTDTGNALVDYIEICTTSGHAMPWMNLLLE